MELSVYNIKGEDTGKKVTLNDAVFGIEPNEHAIYLDVKQYMANKRQGTHKSKERSEVSGSTRKLIRQKGSGGARRGDINSPVMVGGGRVFDSNRENDRNGREIQPLRFCGNPRCRQATDQRSRRRPLQCNRCFGKHDYEKRKTQKSLY